MVYPISKYIIWPFLRLFIKKLEGVENIPDRPCVIACNHSSYIDAVIIIFLMAWYKNKRVRSIAIREHFTCWFWDAIFKWAGAIRVNGSLEKAVKALKKGDSVLIFPEGARTYTGEMKKVEKTGMGVMTLLTKVPVLPMAMNTFNWWNRHQKIPNFKRNIKIKIGKPKTFKNLKPTKTNARRVVKTVMKEVKKLKSLL